MAKGDMKKSIMFELLGGMKLACGFRNGACQRDKGACNKGVQRRDCLYLTICKEIEYTPDKWKVRTLKTGINKILKYYGDA